MHLLSSGDLFGNSATRGFVRLQTPNGDKQDQQSSSGPNHSWKEKSLCWHVHWPLSQENLHKDSMLFRCCQSTWKGSVEVRVRHRTKAGKGIQSEGSLNQHNSSTITNLQADKMWAHTQNILHILYPMLFADSLRRSRRILSRLLEESSLVCKMYGLICCTRKRIH